MTGLVISCSAMQYYVLGNVAHQIMFLATTSVDQRDAPLGHAKLRRIDIMNQCDVVSKMSILLYLEIKTTIW